MNSRIRSVIPQENAVIIFSFLNLKEQRHEYSQTIKIKRNIHILNFLHTISRSQFSLHHSWKESSWNGIPLCLTKEQMKLTDLRLTSKLNTSTRNSWYFYVISLCLSCRGFAIRTFLWIWVDANERGHDKRRVITKCSVYRRLAIGTLVKVLLSCDRWGWRLNTNWVERDANKRTHTTYFYNGKHVDVQVFWMDKGVFRLSLSVCAMNVTHGANISILWILHSFPTVHQSTKTTRPVSFFTFYTSASSVDLLSVDGRLFGWLPKRVPSFKRVPRQLLSDEPPNITKRKGLKKNNPRRPSSKQHEDEA